MKTKQLIRILKKVPETHLRLFSLAHKVIGEGGTVDPNKVAFNYKEIKEAIDEAKAYSGDTKEAVQCLKQMDRFSP